MLKKMMSRMRGMVKGRAKPTSGKATPSSGPKPAPSKRQAQPAPSSGSKPSPDSGMHKAQTTPNRRAEAKKAMEAAKGKRGAMRKKDAKSQTAPHGGKVSSGPKPAASRRSTARDAARGKKPAMRLKDAKPQERPMSVNKDKKAASDKLMAERAGGKKVGTRAAVKGAKGGMQKLPDSAVTDGKKKAKSESMGKKFNERMGKSVKAATSKKSSADGPTPSASVKPKAKKEAPKAKSKSIGDSIAKKREAKAKLKSKQKLLKPTSGAAKKPTKGAPPKATKTNRKAPTKSTKKPIRYTRGMARGFAAMKNKDK
jgi:hypothetical protein